MLSMALYIIHMIIFSIFYAWQGQSGYAFSALWDTVKSEILASRTADVDAASGAIYSSNEIKEAGKNALEKALNLEWEEKK